MCSVSFSNRRFAAAAAAALLSGMPAAVGQAYRVEDLGTLGGPLSGAFALNSFGQVAGVSALPSGDFHAWIWSNGLTEIGPLAGDSQSHAIGINSGGVVVAQSYDLGDLVGGGLLWSAGGGTTTLGGLAPRGVNDAGTVVGYLTVLDAAFGWVDHAARWSDGTLTDLGTLGGHFSYACAVNAAGRIVGMSYPANDTDPRAVLYQGGAWRDLGTLGGAASYAYNINDAGEVVGVADTATGGRHAFRFVLDGAGNVTQRIDLGTLGGSGSSAAYSINGAGDAVGMSNGRAVLFSAGLVRELTPLVLQPDADWRLDTAWAINEGGQIVGSGLHHGQPRAFRLTPICPGDVDGNGVVNQDDLDFVLFYFGQAVPVGQNGDADFDGVVDQDDLDIVLFNYGTGCG